MGRAVEQLNPQNVNKTTLFNSNSLSASSPKSDLKNNLGKFSNELAKLRESDKEQLIKFGDVKNENNSSDENEIVRTPNFGGQKAFGSQEFNKETLAQDLKRREIDKEKQQMIAGEDARKDSEEKIQKYTSSESTMATTAQSNHKVVTNAVKEGNVSEQQARQQHNEGNDRKKQLANWQEMAPRIIEDIKNRAVRIDIPGVYDLQTLIVRMQQNQVVIQAVGSESAMTALKDREGELKSRLGKKNITVAQLDTFDINKLQGRAT